MVTREEFQLYLAAKWGDFSGLADMLRSGAELSQEVRNLLADILQGKIKIPKHRPPDPDKSDNTYAWHTAFANWKLIGRRKTPARMPQRSSK